jgi:hypothetical protein
VGDLLRGVVCLGPNLRHPLAVLRCAGLFQCGGDGSTVFYRLADNRVLEAYRLIQSLAAPSA